MTLLALTEELTLPDDGFAGALAGVGPTLRFKAVNEGYDFALKTMNEMLETWNARPRLDVLYGSSGSSLEMAVRVGSGHHISDEERARRYAELIVHPGKSNRP